MEGCDKTLTSLCVLKRWFSVAALRKGRHGVGKDSRAGYVNYLLQYTVVSFD